MKRDLFLIVFKSDSLNKVKEIIDGEWDLGGITWDQHLKAYSTLKSAKKELSLLAYKDQFKIVKYSMHLETIE